MGGANTGESDGLSPGSPGARWRNWTSWTWYQWVSDLVRPCAVCLRRHGRLFPRRQGKYHPNCRCVEIEVKPGELAPIPAEAPATVWAKIPAAGRAALVGEDTLKLIRAGVVSLSDVIGDESVGWILLAFTEAIRRKKLTPRQLVGAGVDDATARRAVEAAAGGR